uniref:Mitochondrial chaperone BCS1 n=1 Tax=Globodera rostochiensis TaxID=31243 RepID=A0A914IFR5_GLORO
MNYFSSILHASSSAPLTEGTATVAGGNARQSLFDTFAANPLFTGGAGLMGVGVLFNYGRKLALVGASVLRRKYVSTLELSNEDQAYKWVLDFINKQSQRKTNQLSVSSSVLISESGKASTRFFFMPGQGHHYMNYGRRWVRVERERTEQMLQRDDMRRTPLETVRLTTIGVTPDFWRQLLEKAAKDALSEVETGLAVYTPLGPAWHHFGKPRKKRPLETIVLDDGIREAVQADLESFFNSHKWYTDRGIPYRRGYLFYGPPGTGKSSFISALAAHYGYNICMLSLSDRTMDDLRLNHLMNSAPSYSFLLLEDIDNAFVRRDNEADNAQLEAFDGLTRVTMSGLLNAIDGVVSAEERVLFMTTNHVRRLDPALIRPGRVDVKQYFGNCTGPMLEQMFAKFFDGISAEMCAQFRDKVSSLDNDFSPASIQGHLLNYKTEPALAIQNWINRLLRSHQGILPLILSSNPGRKRLRK